MLNLLRRLALLRKKIYKWAFGLAFVFCLVISFSFRPRAVSFADDVELWDIIENTGDAYNDLVSDYVAFTGSDLAFLYPAAWASAGYHFTVESSTYVGAPFNDYVVIASASCTLSVADDGYLLYTKPTSSPAVQYYQITISHSASLTATQQTQWDSGGLASTDSGFITLLDNYSVVAGEEYWNGWSQGREDGIDIGFAQGVASAFTDAYDGLIAGTDNYDDGAWSSGYYEGVAFGSADSLTNAFAIQSFIPGVLGSFLGFFWQMATIEILGISAVSILITLFTISAALLFFKVFLQK